MAERRNRRQKPPVRGLIAPLVMLACGVMAGVFLWQLLMTDRGPAGGLPEGLSRQDRQALQRLLDQRHARQ